jgi:hypothetical protein
MKREEHAASAKGENGWYGSGGLSGGSGECGEHNGLDPLAYTLYVCKGSW